MMCLDSSILYPIAGQAVFEANLGRTSQTLSVARAPTTYSTALRWVLTVCLPSLAWPKTQQPLGLSNGCRLKAVSVTAVTMSSVPSMCRPVEPAEVSEGRKGVMEPFIVAGSHACMLQI